MTTHTLDDLIEAALDQPNPSPELVKALNAILRLRALENYR